MLTRSTAWTVVLGIALFAPGLASATPTSIQSDNANTAGDGTGHFTGSLNYVYTTGNTATLTVTLTNTTTAGGHFLTGFVLNSPENKSGVDVITKTTLSTATNFTNIAFSDGGVKAAPFGQFDFGAAIGGSWEGGGNPNPGLAPGASGTFTFALTGASAADLAALTTQSFVNALSSGGQPYDFIAVRFRGGTDSDKEPGKPVASPEPSSFILGGLSGICVIGVWFVSRQRRAALGYDTVPGQPGGIVSSPAPRSPLSLFCGTARPARRGNPRWRNESKSWSVRRLLRFFSA